MIRFLTNTVWQKEYFLTEVFCLFVFLFSFFVLYFSLFLEMVKETLKKKKKGIVWLGEKPKIGSVCVDLL